MKRLPGVIPWLERLADDVHGSGALLRVEGEGGEPVQLSGSGPILLVVEQEPADLAGQGWDQVENVTVAPPSK